MAIQTRLEDMVIGDKIRCAYEGVNAGKVGRFEGLGKTTKLFIHVASATTTNGSFYFIYVGNDFKGRRILIADRNVQHSISWDALNTAGVATKDGLPISSLGLDPTQWKTNIRLLTGGTSATTTANSEWDKYIVNGPYPGDNATWNWNVATASWTSTVPTTNKFGETRVKRGYNSETAWWNNDITSTAASTVGFRPVLVAESLAPPTPPTSFLIQDGTEVKTYQGGWQPVADASEATFLSSGVTNLSSVPADAWNELGDTFEVLQYVSDVEYSRALFETEAYTPFDLLGDTPSVLMYHDDPSKSTGMLTLTEIPHGQLVFQESDIDVSQVESLRIKHKATAGYSENIVSTMTSYSTPAPYVVSSSGSHSSYPAWKAFDGLNGFGWIANSWTGWISFDYGEGNKKIVSKYAIISSPKGTSQPKAFTFEGSNDSSSWTVLDQRTDESIFANGEKRGFEFENETAYRFYRINVTSTYSSTPLEIGEIEMYEKIKGNTDVKILISGDSGATWAGKDHIDLDDLSTVKANGYTPDEITSLTKEEIRMLFPNGTARFAYYLEQDQLTDTVLVDSLTITASPVSTETPTLNSVKIGYDDVTIEGRMRDLEKINAINMGKLQFKTNALMNSKKYKLHELVVDTFEEDSMVAIESDGTETKTKEFTSPSPMEDGYYSEVSLVEFKSIKGVSLS